MNTKNKKTIIDALGLEELTPTEQEDMLLTVDDLVFKSALVRLIERMGDKERDEFLRLLDSDATATELDAFLNAVPGSETVVDEALDELTDDILAVT